MKFSKDKSGNEYLPYEEKERVMEYLRPENEDEKIKILKYEEEKIKFWQDMPNEAKIKLVQKLENSLPLQALYEHEVGLQEKMFKPILKPNQTVEELVYKLNKEAELGVEYKAMNEKPHGEVIVKLVKPAYRVNIGKMGEVDIEKLRKIAEKELIKKEGKLHQKEIERRMKEMAEGLERGMGTFDEKSLKKKDAQRAIAMVMKETPFSRAGDFYFFVKNKVLKEFYYFLIYLIF